MGSGVDNSGIASVESNKTEMAPKYIDIHIGPISQSPWFMGRGGLLWVLSFIRHKLLRATQHVNEKRDSNIQVMLLSSSLSHAIWNRNKVKSVVQVRDQLGKLISSRDCMSVWHVRYLFFATLSFLLASFSGVARNFFQGVPQSSSEHNNGVRRHGAAFI